MTALQIIRLIGTEFSDLIDTTINTWIELAEPFVSKKIPDTVYNTALAYYTAHLMKMNGIGNNTLGDMRDMAVTAGAAGIGSLSEGGSSISFTGASQTIQSAEQVLSKTVYGQQYLALVKVFTVPITINS